jgi:hypothetical protein
MITAFSGFTFKEDASGHPWINSSCEGPGALVRWPNKDQWRDEVEQMEISVAIPSNLVDVSNGRFIGKTDLGDGYTRWDWLVHYPINNYNVSVNIGDEKGFAMPVRVGKKEQWQIIRPTTEWKTMTSSIKKGQFDVATDLYYVNVTKSFAHVSQ